MSDEAYTKPVRPHRPGTSPRPGPGRTGDSPPSEDAASAEDAGADEPTPDGLVRAIQELDRRLARSEDEAVAATMLKGQLLTDLKEACAKRAWGKRLGELGINARVATRLMAIGTWGREFGPVEADLLSRLPGDPHKLEALVKLPPEQLRQLVADLDCRAKPRASVIRAVKEVLGHAKPAAEADDGGTVLLAIEKLIKRLIGQFDKLDAMAADGDAGARVRGLLDTAVERLEQLVS